MARDRSLKFLLLLLLSIGVAMAASECPGTSRHCECEPGLLRCDHGHVGFPVVASRPDIINFEFSDCLLDANLTGVPYANAETIIMHNCAIESIAADAFQQTYRVDILAVTGNRELKTIDALAFRGLLQLIDLDLSGNDLRHLPRGVFDNLPALRRVELSGNRIQLTAGSDLFGSASPLTEFACNECHLNDVPIGALSALRHLEHLQLSRNNFPSLVAAQFQPLTTLRTLALDNCNISLIADGAFKGLRNLTTLRLGHNRLMSLGDDLIYAALPELLQLELNNNLMTSLPPGLLPWLSEITHLRLAYNAWTCDCQAEWMQVLSVEDDDYVFCSQPESVQNRLLFELEDHELCDDSAYAVATTFLRRPAVLGILLLTLLILSITLAAVGCRIHQRRARKRGSRDSMLKYNQLQEELHA